jgi:hypothetical protein
MYQKLFTQSSQHLTSLNSSLNQISLNKPPVLNPQSTYPFRPPSPPPISSPYTISNPSLDTITIRTLSLSFISPLITTQLQYNTYMITSRLRTSNNATALGRLVLLAAFAAPPCSDGRRHCVVGSEFVGDLVGSFVKCICCELYMWKTVVGAVDVRIVVRKKEGRGVRRFICGGECHG